MALVFQSKVTENQDLFISEVKRYCSLLGIDPNWLMAIMYFESGLDHRRLNTVSGAYGLIQFMPYTIINEFGISVSEFKALNNAQQLYYVYLYLKKYTGKMNSLTDVYFAVFFPAAMGKESTYVLQTSSLSASLIAKQNPIFDPNNDNKVTVAEVSTTLVNWLKKKGISFQYLLQLPEFVLLG